MKPGDTAAASPALRQAAREWLDLDLDLGPDATLAATRAALLRRVAAAHYVPDPVSHEAVLALAGGPVGPALILAEQETATQRDLARRVEAFAAEFFQIPVADRRATWLALGQATVGDDRLQTRLRRLEPGLVVDPSAAADPNPLVRRLAIDLLELFPLDPRARAELSRAKVLLVCQDPQTTFRDRSNARRDLLRRHPAIAALLHGYLDELARPRRSHEANRRRAWSSSFLHRDLGSFDLNTKSAGPWFVVLFLMGLIRTFSSHQGTSPRPSPPVSFPVSSTAPAPIRPPGVADPLFGGMFDQLRVRLRREISAELNAAGVKLSTEELRSIGAAIPLGLGKDNLSMDVFLGQFSARDTALLADVIQQELQRGGKDLPAAQVASLARLVLQAVGPKSKAPPEPTPTGNAPPRGQP